MLASELGRCGISLWVLQIVRTVGLNRECTQMDGNSGPIRRPLASLASPE